MQIRQQRERYAAFTLIEMMVVVAIIGILIAGVFKLMGVVGESNKKALTISRMQKLQNALSGFYAEYGTYPPVAQHGSPDPFSEQDAGSGNYSKVGALTAKNANRAASCQPISFEYPNVESLNEYINTRFRDQGIINVNEALGANAGSKNAKSDWESVQIFKFGALSYLLPRVELMGGDDAVKGTGDIPNINFFSSPQWTKNNSGSRNAQRTRENRAVARWLPNFEGCLYGGYPILGISTAEPDHGGPHLVGGPGGSYPLSGNGIKYLLVCVTIHDGWGRDLYYYSAPPYQSYRVWSAGPDGNTFPPWITLDSLSPADRKTVSSWVEDDVVRFDH